MHNVINKGKYEGLGATSSESTQVWHALSRDLTVLAATHAFIHEYNEPYLPLPSQPKLAVINRPREGWKAELA